jgi:type IV fimbrial biogenesis protein FimT
MHNQKGFSLIELIVVITIIAIAVGITIPVYSSMKPKLRLNGAARQMQGDLMRARMQAISQNNEFRLSFSDDNHQYYIWVDVNGNGAPDSDESPVTKDIQTNYYDVVFDSVPSQKPKFYPRGTLWPLGFTITLKNSSGTKDVVVSYAGRIRIE